MIAIFRFLFVVGFVGGVWLAVTEGFWTGVGAFLTVGSLLWVALTLVRAFQGLRTALSRPNVNVHVWGEGPIEDWRDEWPLRHPDPTRPGLEDTKPFSILDDREDK